MLGWLFTGAGAVLLALVFANLGRALPRQGGPYAYAKRAFGDFVGFQTAWGYWIAVWAGNAAIAVAFVSYLTVFWPAGRRRQPARRPRRHRADLAADGHQHPRRARGRDRAARHHRPEVRAAGRHRDRRPVLHRRRQLRAVRPERGEPQPAVDDRRADAVGLHRPRVGDRAGRRGQGPRADDPARDDHRHRPRDGALPRRHGGDHGDHPHRPARGLHVARSRTRPARRSAAAGTR